MLAYVAGIQAVRLHVVASAAALGLWWQCSCRPTATCGFAWWLYACWPPAHNMGGLKAGHTATLHAPKKSVCPRTVRRPGAGLHDRDNTHGSQGSASRLPRWGLCAMQLTHTHCSAKRCNEQGTLCMPTIKSEACEGALRNACASRRAVMLRPSFNCHEETSKARRALPSRGARRPGGPMRPNNPTG